LPCIPARKLTSPTKNKWDFSQPTDDDRSQWNTLVQEWLALDARGRHPYHLKSAASGLEENAPHLPSQDRIDRVLLPYQTVQERNAALSAHLGTQSPAWLRTCYNPGLAAQYSEFAAVKEHASISYQPSNIFDDEERYAELASDWRGILRKVPSIPDAFQMLGDPDVEIPDRTNDDWEEAPEERQTNLYEAQKPMETLLYLIDEEALRQNVIKLLWLDRHGNCIWNNTIRPENIDALKGPIMQGYTLAEIDGHNALADDAFWERGSLILSESN
jgi:hypothetical protein